MSDIQKIKSDVLSKLYFSAGDNISETQPLSKYGVTGFELAEALIRLENQYSIRLPLQKMNVNITLAQIVNMFAEKMQKKNTSPAQTEKPTYEKIESAVRQAIDMFGIKGIIPNKSLKHYGLDFMDALSLMNMLEKKFLLPESMISDAVNEAYKKKKAENSSIISQDGFFDVYNSANLSDLIHILCQHFQIQEPGVVYDKVQGVKHAIVKATQDEIQK